MANRHKTSELENLPPCAAEFIRLVIKKMRYRRKVRRDVKAELASHFEDELADCGTDQEKEQKAQKLIDDFGDAKLLAVLLRRAKKRCRPLWRTVAARAFQTVGVLILLLVLYCVYISFASPTITVDYIQEADRLARQGAKPPLAVMDDLGAEVAVLPCLEGDRVEMILHAEGFADGFRGDLTVRQRKGDPLGKIVRRGWQLLVPGRQPVSIDTGVIGANARIPSSIDQFKSPVIVTLGAVETQNTPASKTAPVHTARQSLE